MTPRSGARALIAAGLLAAGPVGAAVDLRLPVPAAGLGAPVAVAPAQAIPSLAAESPAPTPSSPEGSFDISAVPAATSVDPAQATPADASAASGAAFDGSAAALPATVEPDDLALDVAEARETPIDLYLTKQARGGVRKGKFNAHVGLIKGAGSEWWWSKYKEGGLIALKSGTQTLFLSRVTEVKSVTIGELRRADFTGLMTPQRLAGKTLDQLRRIMVEDFRARNPAEAVSLESKVTLVRFLAAAEAKQLPENRDESSFPAIERAPVQVPAALQDVNRMLPKAVVVDMRLFKKGAPYGILEDMTKLMKAGVYFILVSDESDDGPRAVEKLLTQRLSVRQRDQISRYKMVVLSDDGNSLRGYSGNFARPMPSRRFTADQRERMEFVARMGKARVSVQSTSTRFEVALQPGVDVEAYQTELRSALKKMGISADGWVWTISERKGAPLLTIRPQNLVSALPHLFEQLRQREGLFVNPSDLMVVSQDPALLKATHGAIQPSTLSDASGEALADVALASLIGSYRLNLPGDIAASASKIQSMLQKREPGGFGGGSIYMLTGHVMHSAFNWAIWKYRNTGILPSADEMIAIAKGIWDEENAKSQQKLLTKPGESVPGFHETIAKRLAPMHEIVAKILQTHPIIIGTEIPNLAVLERRLKGGALDRRDIFRFIYDFVAARRLPDGTLEVLVLDFKTGQNTNLQNLAKDLQVQLYDMLVRRMWPTLPVPYANGESAVVSAYRVVFIYTMGPYEPVLNDWSRLTFEKALKNYMQRMRKAAAPPAK